MTRLRRPTGGPPSPSPSPSFPAVSTAHGLSGALFCSLPPPYSLDTHTFTLSTIGNLSDRSFITRLDYSLVVLTHVRFEAFVSGRYGNEHGEFRFGIRNLDLGGFVFSRAPAFMDFGLALRVAI